MFGSCVYLNVGHHAKLNTNLTLMIVNKILEIILLILSVVVIPVQIVTTFVLGLLVRLTFGLLLIPISIIWTVLFLGPLVALSYIYEKVYITRIFVAIVGLPIAVIGNIFCCLMPSMGEKNDRVTKMLLSNIFPFTWHCFQYNRVNTTIEFSKGYFEMLKLLDNYAMMSGNLWRDCVIHMKANYEVRKKYN